MKKRMLALVVCTALLFMLACNLPGLTPTSTPLALPSPERQDDPLAGWLTYTDTLAGFSIQYPPTATLTVGEMARIDFAILPNTNLSEKYLQIEYGSLAEPCLSPLGAGYEPGMIPQSEVSLAGETFTRQEGADAGAGNLYEWVSYSLAGEGMCVTFDFILHSSNPEMYDDPPARYDQAAEQAIFEAVLATFERLP